MASQSPDYDDELKISNKKKNGIHSHPESTFMTLAAIWSIIACHDAVGRHFSLN